MIKAYLLKRNKSKSLRTQIRNVERELLNRQRRTGVRTATLVRKIQQQMTAPATLLLAGGIGFILGELTQCQTAKSRGAADKLRKPSACWARARKRWPKPITLTVHAFTAG